MFSVSDPFAYRFQPPNRCLSSRCLRSLGLSGLLVSWPWSSSCFWIPLLFWFSRSWGSRSQWRRQYPMMMMNMFLKKTVTESRVGSCPSKAVQSKVEHHYLSNQNHESWKSRRTCYSRPTEKWNRYYWCLKAAKNYQYSAGVAFGFRRAFLRGTVVRLGHSWTSSACFDGLSCKPFWSCQSLCQC